MSHVHPLPPYSLFLFLLRMSLLAGALLDLGIAALLVLAPGLVARFVRVPFPEEPFHLWLLAILLVAFGACSLLAAWAPVAYEGNVAVVIVVRLTVAGALALAARGRSDFDPLLLLAGVDFTLAVVHVACWLPIRR